MGDLSILNILLHGEEIGSLVNIGHDRTIFSFKESYIENSNRAVLGLRFRDSFGQLITEFKPTRTRLMPYFSNLLPEGHLRDYLSQQTGLNPEREFFLLKELGLDLPGAITAVPDENRGLRKTTLSADLTISENNHLNNELLRFSLAGVQLKFSAICETTGGLTIPVQGIGGSWIVKLPSTKFAGVPENEYSMMSLARLIGIDVPSIDLVKVNDISKLPAGISKIQGEKAFVIKRFDRRDDGSPVHVEDFAQVFDLYPGDKYRKARSSTIAKVIAAESCTEDIVEFIRRLTFNTLIGNADMHLKNWSLIYPDRRNARLSPAYDFVSTVAYIEDEQAALRYSNSKRFDEFSVDELKHLCAKALIPEKIVLDTAKETIELFQEHWQKEKSNLPLYPNVAKAIDKQIKKVPITKAG